MFANSNDEPGLLSHKYPCPLSCPTYLPLSAELTALLVETIKNNLPKILHDVKQQTEATNQVRFGQQLFVLCLEASSRCGVYNRAALRAGAAVAGRRTPWQRGRAQDHTRPLHRRLHF